MNKDKSEIKNSYWQKFLQTGNIAYYLKYKRLVQKDVINNEEDLEISRISDPDQGL